MKIKKIDFGKTTLKDLHHIFKLSSPEELENKRARLFPNGNNDNEIATTSIFLASLSAVKEYREELFNEIGVNKLKARNAILHVYTELNNSKNGNRPDGLIVITSGKYTPVVEWACFIETKVKDNEICAIQIEKYVDFAREVGINDIITISNYLVTNPKESPIKLKKRSFNLYHWSWVYLKVTALRLIKNNLIEDEDHIFILKELRRFFDNHKNLYNFVNMGKDWKESVNKIHKLDLSQKVNNDILQNIIKSYKQEEKDISLQLTDKSNFHVELIYKNNRSEELENMLQNSRCITSNFMINRDKKNIFSIEVDFLRQKIKCYTNIIITKGKAQAQTTALIKMFEEIGATDHILINAYYNRKKCNHKDISLTQLINEKKRSEFYSILDKNLGNEVKFFEIKTEDLLGKDFQNVKNFIIKLENTALRFLTQVMANKKN
jgi:hypothetical protein